MDFAVAYTTNEEKIATAIQRGKIDSGDMILVIDSADDIYGHLVILDNNSQQVKVSTSMRKFASLAEANAWLNKTVNKPVGEIVSIRENDTYKLKIVNTTAAGGYTFTDVAAGGVAGVTSVNGKTGAVTITSDDIPAGTVNQVFTVTDKNNLAQALTDITNIKNEMLSKTGVTMEGNINMNGHDISNIQRVHVNGNAPLYIGSTIEAAGTNATRMTGTTDGEISFVKADTQNTLSNINVAEPTKATHAATKKYVDDQLANAGKVKSVNGKDGDVVLTATDVAAVPTAGGTMTGDLVLNGAPTANNMAATKKYVDDSVAAAGNVPPSTQADQGKVLTVDAQGVAAWASANSDAVVIVTMTEAGGVITADKTVAEIKAEHDKSKEVIALYNNAVYQLTYASNTEVDFASADVTGTTRLRGNNGNQFFKASADFINKLQPVGTVGKLLKVGADNIVVADGEAIPDHTAGDDGKVLTAKADGSVEWVKNGGLPETTPAQANKFLTVDNQGNVVWKDIEPDEALPDHTVAEANKVLGVKADNTVGWVDAPNAVESVNTKTGAVVLNATDVGALPISGGTLTGSLTLNGAPTTNLEAATKKYVDDSVAGAGGLPASTPADDGKVLTVDGNGTAQWEVPDSLPTSTTADDGKVLLVDNTGAAKWDYVNKSATFTVTFTLASQTPEQKVGFFRYLLNSDKTPNDIWAAIQAGKTIIAIYDNEYYTVEGSNYQTGIAFVRSTFTDGAYSVNRIYYYWHTTQWRLDMFRLLASYPNDNITENHFVMDMGGQIGLSNTKMYEPTQDNEGMALCVADAHTNLKDRRLEWKFVIPNGGLENQVLQKQSDTNQDFAWSSNGLAPRGGNVGYMLMKRSANDYDFMWSKPDELLPTSTAADAGKVLIVNNNGDPRWTDNIDCGELV